MELKGQAFPSLLFTGAPRRGDVPMEVFWDLKLDNLLDYEDGGRVTGVMSGLCPVGDVVRRRELFDEVRKLDAGSQGGIVSGPVRDIADAIGQAAYLMKVCRGRSGDARALVYVYLCIEFCRFCGKASELEARGFFLRRFADFFRAYRKSDGFPEFEAEAGRLGELLPGAAFVYRWNSLGGFSDGALEDGSFFDRICERIRDDTGDLFLGGADDEGTLSERVSDAFAGKMLALYPDLLKEIRAFYEKYNGFFDEKTTEYSAEFEFIFRILSLEDELTELGIPLCTPEFSDRREIVAESAYDLTLIGKDETNIVPNDIFLTEKEPLFFLSGANGGGKTTYLRAVGANVLLALSGARAAAKSLTIGGIDGVYTHFPQDEDYIGEGRFEGAIRRADRILEQTAVSPLVLFNETFSSTNELRSRRAIEDYAAKLLRRGAFGVYVTHTAGVKVPGVGSLICETDGSTRTYRIVRAENTEGARATDLIEKYGLTPGALRARFAEREEDGV